MRWESALNLAYMYFGYWYNKTFFAAGPPNCLDVLPFDCVPVLDHKEDRPYLHPAGLTFWTLDVAHC